MQTYLKYFLYFEKSIKAKVILRHDNGYALNSYGSRE